MGDLWTPPARRSNQSKSDNQESTTIQRSKIIQSPLILMHIDIWSDIVCPWCYLGRRRLERALDEFEHRDEVSIAHRSFQLDPSRPKHVTMNRRQMLTTKYHLTEDQVAEMDDKMQRTAALDGLTYQLTPEGVTGNTIDAHRLLHFAKARGREAAVLDRLYRA